MYSSNNVIAFILAVMMFAGIAGQAAAQNARKALAASSTIEIVKKRGTLRAGVGTFVPWVFRAKTGELAGFEIDVAAKIAKDMGVKIESVPTAWDGIIPALLAGKFDIVMSGMAIDSKRNLTVNFSMPYHKFGNGVAGNKNLIAGMTKIEDFNKPEITFACRRGSLDCQRTMTRWFPKATFLYFDDDQQVIQDVLNGKSHVFTLSEPNLNNTVLDHSDVLIRPFGHRMFQQWLSGFAIPKGDPDTLNFLNSWIYLNQENGFLEERAAYWFRTRDWQSMVSEN